MRRLGIFAIVLIALATICVVPTGAQAEQEIYPEYLACVNDVDGLLHEDQELKINAALELAREKAGIPICVYVFERSYGEKYIGDHFLAEHGLNGSRDLVLLVVSVGTSEINYDIYTYGDASLKINQKEIGYILDDSDVFNNLKNGRIEQGLCAYAELTAQAYAGRLGVSWGIILFFALIIGAVAGALTVGSIKASYKRKNPSQSYPLDRYAKLDLTHERDRELGKFVTTTIISSGSRGHGGGGRTGGGGGHRGGR